MAGVCLGYQAQPMVCAALGSAWAHTARAGIIALLQWRIIGTGRSCETRWHAARTSKKLAGLVEAVTNRCHIAHLRAGMCTRKCCQAENHTSHRRAWTGGMAPTVYQCGHVRSLATRLRTRRRGGTVACTCVCMRDESAIIARGVLRQYEYRCFLILGRHPLVLYVSVVLARCVRRMRGQIHQASVHQRRQRARRCAYPQHNHNITCLGGSTCSQRSHARDPSHIALDIAPNHRQASRHHPHPTGGEREV